MATECYTSSSLPEIPPQAYAGSLPATSDPSCPDATSSTPLGDDWALVEEGYAEAFVAAEAEADAIAGSASGHVLEADSVPDGAADPPGSESPLVDGKATTAQESAEEFPPRLDAAPTEQNPELDLCFLCDCTGSMGHYIRSAQQNIRDIVGTIKSNNGAAVRFGLISYRDHPPQELSYVTRAFPFTEDVQKMKGYVDTMFASGGGDGPEAVTAALSDALSLPWRPNATKIVILIADAPPHGLEASGDGFPNGDPEGRDPLEIARGMAAEGIVCYSVGCEPGLGRYQFARDFMCTLAEITGGQAVALGSAALLAQVIVNGSAEEISLTRLQREVEREVESVRASAARTSEAPLSDVACARIAAQNLEARGVRSTRMETDGAYLNRSPSVWHASPTQTLAAAKAELVSRTPTPAVPEVPRKRLSAGPGAGYSWAMASAPGSAGAPSSLEAPRAVTSAPASCKQRISTLNFCVDDVISEGQVQRLMMRRSKHSAD